MASGREARYRAKEESERAEEDERGSGETGEEGESESEDDELQYGPGERADALEAYTVSVTGSDRC